MNKRVVRTIIWVTLTILLVNVVLFLYLLLRPEPIIVTSTTVTSVTSVTSVTTEPNVFAAHFGHFKTRVTTKRYQTTTKRPKRTTVRRITTRRTTSLPPRPQTTIETSPLPEFCLDLPVPEAQRIRLPPRDPLLVYKYWKEIDGMRKRDKRMWISTNNPKTDKHISGTIHRGRQWEPDIVAQIRRHIRGSGYTFVDVGANIGYFSLLAVQTGARAISFEPIWENCQRMLHTRKRNMIPNERWEIHCEAVDAVENVLYKMAVTTTLDNHVKGTIHLLKIDVEGYEPRVLTGASSLIENRCIKAIIVEQNAKKGICSWVGMEKWLDENGCNPTDMQGRRIRMYAKPKTANMMYVCN